MPELVCPAANRDVWLVARRQGITATDIVTILGLSPYDSPYSLFWRKLGQIPEVPDNDRFKLGRYLEPYAIERWMLEHPDVQLETAQGLYRSSARPWQLATPDGLLEGAVFEAKTSADIAGDQWGDGIPPAVRAQVLWQMDVMDVAAGHVGVLFLPSGEFRSYIIEHAFDSDGAMGRFSPGHQDLCAACQDLLLMRDQGLRFWCRIEQNDAPDPDASMATLAAVRARFPRHETKEAEVDGGLWNAWYGARSEIDRWEEIARGYESQLREQAGEARTYLVGGVKVATRVIVDAQIKAHTRHQDYIRRIKIGDDDD
jgi:putative phage-type endonuclease